MEIRWFGSSAFQLRAAAGMVLFDPFVGVVGTGRSLDANTVVTVSNAGVDPAAVAQLGDRGRVLDGPGEYEVSGIGVRGLPTPLEDQEASRRVNTVYVVEVEGLTVCHLGSLRSTLSAQILQTIGRVDILMVSVVSDGLSPEMAAAAVRQIEPTVILPMGHDGSAGAPAVTEFLSELGTAAGEPVQRLSVTRSNLGEEQRVVVLSLQES